ncbi:MAG: L28 family ribosomal protein [bacterium]|nr:L28 family ribosomal protein [bacterium]
MAQICAKCGKGRNIAWRLVKLRGKYNPTAKRIQKPNLQWTKLATGERVKVCTKCKKTLVRT